MKHTLDSFVAIASKGEFSVEIQKRAADLQEELKSKSFISMNKYQEDTVFKQAIQDMNSNLMPERAHALITLKKLIYSKNSNIQTNKAQLITVLRVRLIFDSPGEILERNPSQISIFSKPFSTRNACKTKSPTSTCRQSTRWLRSHWCTPTRSSRFWLTLSTTNTEPRWTV